VCAGRGSARETRIGTVNRRGLANRVGRVRGSCVSNRGQGRFIRSGHRRRFCHRAYLATSKRFRRATVWYLIEIAVQRRTANRGIWRHNCSVGVACPTAQTPRIKLTRPSPGAVLALIKQFDKFRKGHAPSALGHDHCKHAMVRKAAASARHPSLIEMRVLLRIAVILATQVDR